MLFTFRLSPSALVGLSVLALGPQPVLSVFDFVTFSSPSQCAPFTIQYSGGTAPTSWPPQLTVVPFNSTPFSIPLFNAVFNDTSETGHAVTFLPLPQGTQFVASLDDGNGDSAGPVSDVITIDADNSTKCLQFEKNETANPFSLVNTPSQCESFTVNFDTAEAAAPTVRAFITGKLAFTANQTANDATAGSASYLMAAAHGTEVTLLFSDGSNKASSGLLTVGGNRKSSGTCLVAASSSTGKGANATASTSMSASADSMASKQSTAPLSQSAIIAIAASSGAIIVTIVVAMGVWIYRSRRKMKTAALAATLEDGTSGNPPAPPAEANPQMGEKTPSLPSAVPTPVHASWDFQMQTSWGSAHSKSTDSGRTGTGAQRNPLYTNPNLWLASPTSPNTRLADAGAARRTPPAAYAASIRSQFASRSQSHSRSHTQSSKYAPASTPRSPLSPAATISTVDIEHALDMSERFASGSGDSRDPTPPLPLRQYMYAPRDSIRTSAYYAGQFPDPINGAGAARNVHSRTGSATNSSKASSVRGRVTPPNLRLVDRRKPSSPSASLYSLHEDQLESAGANRLLMSSPTVHVSADGEVIREPPQANVPRSPMPSPFPSPL